LGSNQTFKNALLILQHSVIEDQNLIIEALNLIFPDKDFSIKQLQLVDYIPVEVLAKLSDDEIRALSGYEPLPANEKTPQEIALEKLSILDGAIAQKILDNMSRAQILDLIGMTPDSEVPLSKEIVK